MHKFVFADARALRLKVEHEGKRRWFTEVIQNQPGDELLAAARDVLSFTFAEAFSPLEHLTLLGRIRKRSAEALVPCNWCLEAMQVEPVAIPTVFGFEFLEQDLADEPPVKPSD